MIEYLIKIVYYKGIFFIMPYNISHMNQITIRVFTDN